ncbi:MAG: hypothetical protein Tsb002_33140 [Wenzhouxiangellaceae bacterium]
MNKVVSVEIAGQIFWLDEQAYDRLKIYLNTIRQQLVHDECASEIYQDIELRIAELLYELTPSQNKAILPQQLESVITQVGFIDSEDGESALPSSRKIYRDPNNKILAGVCAGLATRLAVPVIVMRLAFIVLTGALGLGVILYLIFWISLDSINSRHAALAAQGKAPTARQIAAYETPRGKPLAQLQRIVFLPLSIIGALIAVIARHLHARRQSYRWLFKNIVAIALLLISLLFGLLIIEFNQNRFFSWPVAWLISAAVIYLLVLVLAIFVREYYLSGSRRRISHRFKVAALLPLSMIIVASFYLNATQSAYQSTEVEKSFTLNGRQLNLVLNTAQPDNSYSKAVDLKLTISDTINDRVHLQIQYSSYGEDKDQATNNLRSINYFYTYDDDTLVLDRYWVLNEAALNRGQQVELRITLPLGIQVASNYPLIVQLDQAELYYTDQQRIPHEKGGDARAEDVTYTAQDQYLHETGSLFRNKVSANEKAVLRNKFCATFFISEAWRCDSNLRQPVAANNRFDHAYEQHLSEIDRLRQYLLADRSILVSTLSEMNQLTGVLVTEYPSVGELQAYIHHLVLIKSAPTSPVVEN